MDLQTAKKMLECDEHGNTLEEAALKRSENLWKVLKRRYAYDDHLCRLFHKRFKGYREFHEWRMLRYPKPVDGYKLSYLFGSDGLPPESVEQYYWVPLKVWYFFHFGSNTAGAHEYPGVQLSNCLIKSYHAGVQHEGKYRHLGSRPTALGAHRLWQEAKLKILEGFLVEFKDSVHEIVLFWIEAWMMTFQRDLAANQPTMFCLPSKESN